MKEDKYLHFILECSDVLVVFGLEFNIISGDWVWTDGEALANEGSEPLGQKARLENRFEILKISYHCDIIFMFLEII